jgi:hypothetical protein
MVKATDSINRNLGRTCDATDKFIRDYSERMKYPVSQLYTVVGTSCGDKQIDSKELDVLNRIIKDIDLILTDLMECLEREGTPEA